MFSQKMIITKHLNSLYKHIHIFVLTQASINTLYKYKYIKPLDRYTPRPEINNYHSYNSTGPAYIHWQLSDER